MNLYLRTCVIVLLGCTSLSSPAQSATQENPARKCTLKGTVVNTVSGEGVKRALVSINGQAGISDGMLTDAEGHFSFEVSDGQLWAFTEKPGFQQSMNERSRRPISSACGSEPLVLRLEPFGVIKGRVTLDDGEPLEHIPVSAHRFIITNGRRHLQQVGSAQTNEDGEFRVRDLAPGSYYISVGPAPLRELESDRSAIPRAYFPGVLERSAAAAVDLTPGQQAEIKMSMKKVEAFSVSGRIVAAEPLQMASIEVLDSSGNHLEVNLRRRDMAEFQIQGLPAGSYMLRAMSYDPKGPAFGIVPLVVSRDIRDVQVPIGKSAPIQVEFHANLSQKDPVPTVFRSSSGLRPQFPNGSVQLLRVDGTGQAYSSVEGAPDKPVVLIRNAMPGKYHVQVYPNSNAYVESVRCGSADLLAEPLTVGPDGVSDPIEISLRDDGAKLSGTVTGTAENPTVLAVADNRLNPFQSGVIKESGTGSDEVRFSFEQLPPGDYTVYAFDSIEHLPYLEPKALEKYFAKAGHVTLSSGQKSEIQLSIIEVGK